MSKQQLGPDNWLHIISHALSLYLEEGGQLDISQEATGLVIKFVGVLPSDSRLHQALRKLLAEEEAHAG